LRRKHSTRGEFTVSDHPQVHDESVRVKSSHNGLLRLIAVFKLLKAVLLIAVGVGALRLVHKDVGDAVERWVELFRLDPNNHYIDIALDKASRLTPGKIKELGLGSLLYAGLFSTEGIGLWLLKGWAEWLTVIITSSLVPFEVYEIWRHPTSLRIVVLAINIAIVGYLLYKIRISPDGGDERGHGHGNRGPSGANNDTKKGSKGDSHSDRGRRYAEPPH
jgi:uncharacterized membrane protein (DUF2068 family)